MRFNLVSLLALSLFLGLLISDLRSKPLSKAVSDTTPTEPIKRIVSLTAKQKPLREAIAEVCRAARVELHLDVDGIKSKGVDLDLLIDLELKDVPLDEALTRILWSLPPADRRFVRTMLGAKVYVGLISTWQKKLAEKMPDWLRSYYRHGLSASIDAEDQVHSISVSDLIDDELFAKIKTLPKLRELTLARKNITAVGLAHLAEFPALEILSLYGMDREGMNGLGDKVLASAAHIKTLRELSAKECGITDAGVRALAPLVNLTALSLGSNRLTDAGVKSLAGLVKLKTLDLSDSIAMDITDEGLQQLSGLQELEILRIEGLKVSAARIAFPKLKSLSVSGVMVGDGMMANIARCRDMRYLHLCYTKVTDEGMQQLAALQELQHLDLDSHFVTDAGIAHLKALPKLQHLHLRASQLSDVSLRHIAEIKSLTRLDLHGTGQPGVNFGRLFTPKGMTALKALPSLDHLALQNFEAGDYAQLAELKQLKVLTMFMVQIGQNEFDLLDERLPNTIISSMDGAKSMRATSKKGAR